MTDNHTELCKKLREEIALFKAARIDPGQIVPALAMIESQAARIQQQALEYVSLQAQCDENLARIAELQGELEATRQERNAAGVRARRELMPAYESRIAELEREKNAAEKHAAAVSSENFELEARIADLEADRDCWRDQASQRVADWDEMRKERDALKVDAERYRWAIASDENATALYAAVFSCGPNAKNSIDAEMDAAIQAEKETR